MMTNCTEWQNQIDAYVDAELPPSDTDRFRTHAEGCAACAAMAVTAIESKSAIRRAGHYYNASPELYGVTTDGGTGYAGTVYELSPYGSSWIETMLHNFEDGNNLEPEGGLIFDQAGNLYDTTTNSYNDHDGNVFKLTPYNGSWTYSVPMSLPTVCPVLAPKAPLTMDASGNIYGTTWDAPAVGFGFRTDALL
jgi:hypothetical protein